MLNPKVDDLPTSNDSPYEQGRKEAMLSIKESSEIFFIDDEATKGGLCADGIEGWNSMVFSKENRALSRARQLGFF
jgi:hypothetical protein